MEGESTEQKVLNTPLIKVLNEASTTVEEKNIKEHSLDTGTVPQVEKPKITTKLKEKLIGSVVSGDKKDETKEPNTIKPQPKKQRKKVDLTAQSLERNFITPVRAMSDFLLKPSDLESLPKTKRRSPYEAEPPITVYWRRDVEAKALEVWGSKENLQTELIKRDIEKKKYQQSKILYFFNLELNIAECHVKFKSYLPTLIGVSIALVFNSKKCFRLLSQIRNYKKTNLHLKIKIYSITIQTSDYPCSLINNYLHQKVITQFFAPI